MIKADHSELLQRTAKVVDLLLRNPNGITRQEAAEHLGCREQTAGRCLRATDDIGLSYWQWVNFKSGRKKRWIIQPQKKREIWMRNRPFFQLMESMAKE